MAIRKIRNKDVQRVKDKLKKNNTVADQSAFTHFYPPYRITIHIQQDAKKRLPIIKYPIFMRGKDNAEIIGAAKDIFYMCELGIDILKESILPKFPVICAIQAKAISELEFDQIIEYARRNPAAKLMGFKNEKGYIEKPTGCIYYTPDLISELKNMRHGYAYMCAKSVYMSTNKNSTPS